MNAIGDGMNGVTSGDNHPKRIPWSQGSYHSEFFKNARRQLKSMRFVHPETRKPVKTDIPCLQNLIDTLEGFQLLWRKLKSLGFQSFDTRNINQDPLENFFGQVKAHDFRSNKPTCYQFEAIFKSLLITSLTSKHSPGFNCEQDSGEFILSDCKSLLSGTQYLPDEVDDEELVLEDERHDLNEGDEQRDIPENSNVHSHSGDLIKALQTRLPSIKSCSDCMLFATETFAMGVNMPARTVVFDAVRKYDGSKFRPLYPTEYIQMAGRAGRRGHDTTGTVMIVCKAEVPNFIDLQAMMCGEPQSLESQFKITYSMVLHLRRLSETVSVKDMMRRSFKEAATLMKEKQIKAELQKIEGTLSKIPALSSCQQELGEFYETAIKYLRLWTKLRPHLLATKKASKNLSEGRVLLISCKSHYNKLAILLDIGKKKEKVTYKVLLLTNVEENIKEEKYENWYQMIALTKKKLFLPSQVPSHEVLIIEGSNIVEITNCSIKTDYRYVKADWEKRQIPRFKDCPPGSTTNAAVQELLRLSLEAASKPEFLLPYTEMVINDINLKSEEQKLKELKQKLDSFLITQADNFEKQFEEAFHTKELEEKRKELMIKLSDEQLRDYPDYMNRVNILKKLGYIDQDERVTLKGRVALKMGTHELFLTELVFKNILTDWSPPEIAALLSALVFQQRTEITDEELSPRLKKLKDMVQQEFENLEKLEREDKLTPAPSLSFGLVRVVYEWARAESFAKIMNLTDVQEGIIVRCIQQLNETLRDVKNAAIIIGNPILKEKMEEASTAIKRDIVFTASLYTQD